MNVYRRDREDRSRLTLEGVANVGERHPLGATHTFRAVVRPPKPDGFDPRGADAYAEEPVRTVRYLLGPVDDRHGFLEQAVLLEPGDEPQHLPGWTPRRGA